ncbi:MAG: cellulose binding domain-containing protein [Clostridiales bacterium]|jgi:fibronectin type 3 domain-containing protein|nr:hypothetical protein [Eubacteriales bacterium]MDH7565249.1 cellulose binding domain-containing protein [Clostridiales bacterium]
MTHRFKGIVSLLLTVAFITSNLAFTFLRDAFAGSSDQVELYMYNGDRSDWTDVMTPRFKLVNKGGDLNLSRVKIRYYYKSIWELPNTFECEKISVTNGTTKDLSTSTVTAQFTRVSNALLSNYYYCELSFSPEAGTLSRDGYVVVQARMKHRRSCVYLYQRDDYSFNSVATDFVKWDKATAYLTSGSSYSIIWGREPDGTTVLPLPEQKSLKVQMYNVDRSSWVTVENPKIRIINTGTKDIPLSEITVRYFFTTVFSRSFSCSSAVLTNGTASTSLDTSHVTGTFERINNGFILDDYQLKIGFSSTSAGLSLKPGGYVELQSVIRFTSWPFKEYQPNDYSFNSSATGYVDWKKTTGYINNVLMWGTEPDGTEAPTVPVPDKPLNLTAVPGDTSVSLTWSPSFGAQTYTVKRSTTKGGPYTACGGLLDTTYTDTGLTNGVTYYYVVSASSAGGESANSSEVSVMPTSNKIKIMTYSMDPSENVDVIKTGVRIENTGLNPIDLSRITANYYYTQNGGDIQKSTFRTKAAVKNSYTGDNRFDTTPINTSYVTSKIENFAPKAYKTDAYFQIGFQSSAGTLTPGSSVVLEIEFEKDKNGQGNAMFNQPDDYSFNSSTSGYTDWMYMTGYIDGKLVWGMEPGAVPVPTVTLTSPKNGDTYAVNSVIPIKADGTYCDHMAAVVLDSKQTEIQLPSSEGNNPVQQGNRFSYNFTPTAPGTYTIYVVGRSTPDESPNSVKGMSDPVTISVTAASLAAPVDVAAALGDGQVSLKWSPVAGALSYKVKRAEIRGGPYTEIASSVTNTSYVDAAVEPGKTYYYVVSAVNEIAESPNSPEAAAGPVYENVFYTDDGSFSYRLLTGSNDDNYNKIVLGEYIPLEMSLKLKKAIVDPVFTFDENIRPEKGGPDTGFTVNKIAAGDHFLDYLQVYKNGNRMTEDLIQEMDTASTRMSFRIKGSFSVGDTLKINCIVKIASKCKNLTFDKENQVLFCMESWQYSEGGEKIGSSDWFRVDVIIEKPNIMQ